jgi:Fe-S cluster biogenesis protein NfuA
VVAPLVEADGGELFVVSLTPTEVILHLAGHCAGCPGASSTQGLVLEPLFRAAAGVASVRVTTGYVVPDGAYRVRADDVPRGE